MGSQRATTVLQTTFAAVSIFANQPLTNRAGPIVAETLIKSLSGVLCGVGNIRIERTEKVRLPSGHASYL